MLPTAVQGVEREVLAKEIDPQDVFPVADAFLVLESEVPAASGICFGHDPWPAELMLTRSIVPASMSRT